MLLDLRLLPPPRRLMFSPGFVRLFVCKQDNSKTYGRILMKFAGYVQNGNRKKRLVFGNDPDHCLDP